MILRLLDEAKAEMRQSALWYDSKRAGLGDEFLDAVELAFEAIEEHPGRHKKLDTAERIARFGAVYSNGFRS